VGELSTQDDNQLLEIYELTERLRPPVAEVSWLVNENHQRYFLFPIGRCGCNAEQIYNCSGWV